MTEGKGMVAENFTPTRWERVKEAFTIWFEKKFTPPSEETPFVPIPEIEEFRLKYYREYCHLGGDIGRVISSIDNNTELNPLEKVANFIALFKVVVVEQIKFVQQLRNKTVPIPKDLGNIEELKEIFEHIEEIIDCLGTINDGDELIFMKKCPSQKKSIINFILNILQKRLAMEGIRPGGTSYYDIGVEKAEGAGHLSSLRKHKDRFRENIDNVLGRMSDKIYEKTFKRQTEHFKKAESKHRWTAILCLLAVLLSASLITAWALNVFCQLSVSSYIKDCDINIFDEKINGKLNAYAFAYLISNKIIITITLFIILSVFLRGYFANNHNKILNRNRYNALMTYNYLNRVTRGNETILQKGTEAMFDQLPTGYTKLQSNKGGDNVSLADITRIIARLIKRS